MLVAMRLGPESAVAPPVRVRRLRPGGHRRGQIRQGSRRLALAVGNGHSGRSRQPAPAKQPPGSLVRWHCPGRRNSAVAWSCRPGRILQSPGPTALGSTIDPETLADPSAALAAAPAGLVRTRAGGGRVGRQLRRTCRNEKPVSGRSTNSTPASSSPASASTSWSGRTRTTPGAGIRSGGTDVRRPGGSPSRGSPRPDRRHRAGGRDRPLCRRGPVRPLPAAGRGRGRAPLEHGGGLLVDRRPPSARGRPGPRPAGRREPCEREARG